MCSWCYAFTPELDQVRRSTGLDVRLVMGGLFVGERTQPLDDPLRLYLRDTWAKVADLSGQPVAFDLLERERWTYDTEPSSRAVVWAREQDPSRALRFFETIQRAFYAQGVDTADEAELAQIATGSGLDADELARALNSSHLARQTEADFSEARSLGAKGFPKLILDAGGERIPVATGYVSAGHMLRSIEAFT